MKKLEPHILIGVPPVVERKKGKFFPQRDQVNTQKESNSEDFLQKQFAQKVW